MRDAPAGMSRHVWVETAEWPADGGPKVRAIDLILEVADNRGAQLPRDHRVHERERAVRVPRNAVPRVDLEAPVRVHAAHVEVRESQPPAPSARRFARVCARAARRNNAVLNWILPRVLYINPDLHDWRFSIESFLSNRVLYTISLIVD